MVRIPSSTNATVTPTTTMEEQPVQAQDEPKTNEHVGTPVATKEAAAATVTRPDNTTGHPPTPDGSSVEHAVVDVPDGRAGEETPASTPPRAESPTALRSSAREPDDCRSFKVVLTCKPAAEGRWHATIAIGRDGCDPVFEASDIADWPEALDIVPGAVAAVQARWAEQPRNRPAPTTIGRTKTPGGSTQTTRGTSADADPGEDAKPAAPGGEDPATSATATGRNAARVPGGTPSERNAARSKAEAGKPATPARTELTGGVEKLTLF